MGPGVASVTCTSTPTAELITATWKDGRVGTYRGIKVGAVKYSATVFGDKGVSTAGIYGHGIPVNGVVPTTDKYVGYEGLATEMAKFLKGGPPPVSAAETLEIFALIQAAEESKAMNGAVTALKDLSKIDWAVRTRLAHICIYSMWVSTSTVNIAGNKGFQIKDRPRFANHGVSEHEPRRRTPLNPAITQFQSSRNRDCVEIRPDRFNRFQFHEDYAFGSFPIAIGTERVQPIGFKEMTTPEFDSLSDKSVFLAGIAVGSLLARRPKSSR